jgi:hypothetical protein
MILQEILHQPKHFLEVGMSPLKVVTALTMNRHVGGESLDLRSSGFTGNSERDQDGDFKEQGQMVDGDWKGVFLSQEGELIRP